MVNRPARKHLKRRLLSRVAELLVPLGFDRAIAGQAIHKMVPDGRLSVHLAFIDHTEDLDVTVDVALRIDVVQELIHRTNTRLSNHEKSQTATVGGELGNIADGAQRRWTIRSEADVEKAASEIVREFVEFGQPYLGRVSRLEPMLETLAANDRTAWEYSPFHGKRCKTILSLALILHGRHEAIALAPRLEQYLAERGDFALEDFRSFVREVLGT